MLADSLALVDADSDADVEALSLALVDADSDADSDADVLADSEADVLADWLAFVEADSLALVDPEALSDSLILELLIDKLKLSLAFWLFLIELLKCWLCFSETLVKSFLLSSYLVSFLSKSVIEKNK